MVPWSLAGILQRAGSGVGSTPMGDTWVSVVTSRAVVRLPHVTWSGDKKPRIANTMHVGWLPACSGIVHLRNAVDHF